MKKILIIIFSIISNLLLSQTNEKTSDINNFKIEQKIWVTMGLFLDTIHNSSFKPRPNFTHSDPIDSSGQLTVEIDSINFSLESNLLMMKGRISGSEFQGWGNEAFIFVGTRLDSVISHGWIHDGDVHIVDTIKCMYIRNFDFCYTNCKLDKSQNYIDFYYALNVKNQNDIIIIAKNNYYAEIYDLKKLIKKYSH
jgi:hypothetical protein